MSNGKKELKPIKQEHNGPTPNYNKKFANLGKFMPDEDEYTTYGSPETVVSETGERVSTETLVDDRLSPIVENPIPMVPHITETKEPIRSPFPITEKKYYIK
jgi:hypothetical protein